MKFHKSDTSTGFSFKLNKRISCKKAFLKLNLNLKLCPRLGSTKNLTPSITDDLVSLIIDDLVDVLSVVLQIVEEAV